MVLLEHGDIGKKKAEGNFGKKAHGLLRVVRPIALITFTVAFERSCEKLSGVPFRVQYENIFSALFQHCERHI
jgi:hypothetical protein